MLAKAVFSIKRMVYMTNNSKLQRGQLIISKQIGSVNIDINSFTRIPSFILPLGNTVGHYPFGFNVLFLSNDETVESYVDTNRR